MLTYVYHLFPNVMVATFPTNVVVVVLEPIAIDRTRVINYTLTDRPQGDTDERAIVHTAQNFVQAGAIEDRDVACAIQRGLASGANEYFEFGRFEGAITHFHRGLHAAIDGMTAAFNGAAPA
jgi:phenylpropionate dioxygenase-like ring-hydroxylating dioxygenase large terminal subunit